MCLISNLYTKSYLLAKISKGRSKPLIVPNNTRIVQQWHKKISFCTLGNLAAMIDFLKEIILEKEEIRKVDEQERKDTNK